MCVCVCVSGVKQSQKRSKVHCCCFSICFFTLWSWKLFQKLIYSINLSLNNNNNNFFRDFGISGNKNETIVFGTATTTQHYETESFNNMEKILEMKGVLMKDPNEGLGE